MSAEGLRNVRWRKSTYSGDTGECIEVADAFPGVTPVRDSKNPDGPVLTFPAGSWAAFVSGVKAGDFPIA